LDRNEYQSRVTWRAVGKVPESLAHVTFPDFETAYTASIGYRDRYQVPVSMMPSDAQHEECPECGVPMAHHLADGPSDRSAKIVPCDVASVNFQCAYGDTAD
jgi:ribosomal protein S27AE